VRLKQNVILVTALSLKQQHKLSTPSVSDKGKTLTASENKHKMYVTYCTEEVNCLKFLDVYNVKDNLN